MCWAQRLFCQEFPKKCLCDKLSPHKFSVAVSRPTLYFLIPCCHGLEKENLVGAFNNLTEKSMLGCARTLSEASCLSTLEHLPHTSEFWRSIHIPAVAVSKEPHN